MRNARTRPEVLRFLNGDSGEISLGENLESVAASTFCRKPANASFQFAKACQPVEKPALKIAPRVWMARKDHTYSANSNFSPFSGPSTISRRTRLCMTHAMIIKNGDQLQ